MRSLCLALVLLTTLAGCGEDLQGLPSGICFGTLAECAGQGDDDGTATGGGSDIVADAQDDSGDIVEVDPDEGTDGVDAELDNGADADAPADGSDDGDPDVPHDPCQGVVCEQNPPCMVAFCLDGECVQGFADEGESCDDNNSCTDGDGCDGNGACQSGDVAQCDDGDPCTQDICDPATENGCVFGEPVECTDNLCAPAECLVDGQCGDPQPITCEAQEFCMEGVCDTETGNCVEVTLLPAQQQALCNDDNPCSVDFCNVDNATCAHESIPGCKCQGVTCDDGDKCTAGECDPATGECSFVVAVVCEDDNPCTSESCNPTTGKCQNTLLSDDECDDDDPCTMLDVCIVGECVGASPKDCADTNPCTLDSCNAQTGECQYESTIQPCDDGDPCTAQDHCENGNCVGTAVACDDAEQCTTDSCDPVSGDCVSDFNALPCDDGDSCTDGDVCTLGVCVGAVITCTDNNPCTSDACNPSTGECVFTELESTCCANDGECESDEPCTVGKCTSDNTCIQIVANDWCLIDDECVMGGTTNPENECQACVTDQGNQNSWTPLADGNPCSDNNPCTENDGCFQGSCSGDAVDCDDNNSCTDDMCVMSTGMCSSMPNSLPCDDGNGCTVGDTCQDGACMFSQPKQCDDGDVCTTDLCVDHNCVTEPVVCDDNSLCTVEFCHPVEQCVIEPEDNVEFSFAEEFPTEVTLGGGFQHCTDPGSFPNLSAGVCVTFSGSIGTEHTFTIAIPIFGKFCLSATPKYGFYPDQQDSILTLSQEGNMFDQGENVTSAGLPGANSTHVLCMFVEPGIVDVTLVEGHHISDHPYDVNFFSLKVLVGTEAETCLDLEAEALGNN